MGQWEALNTKKYLKLRVIHSSHFKPRAMQTGAALQPALCRTAGREQSHGVNWPLVCWGVQNLRVHRAECVLLDRYLESGKDGEGHPPLPPAIGGCCALCEHAGYILHESGKPMQRIPGRAHIRRRWTGLGSTFPQLEMESIGCEMSRVFLPYSKYPNLKQCCLVSFSFLCLLEDPSSCDPLPPSHPHLP